MPDLWMDVDVALTEVPVNILPLIVAADFLTIDAGVTYDEAGMDLVWNFVSTAGVYTQAVVTPTTAGDYDWVAQGNGMYTIEMTDTGGASANNDTEGFGWFTGDTTATLPWRGPTIGFRAAALNNVLIDSAYSATRGLAGTALPAAVADAAGGLVISDAGGFDIDNSVISSGARTALEDQYDGTGLTGDTYPASQAQLAGIANVGSAVNEAPSSYALTTGTQSSGTVASAEAVDQTRHEHTDDGGVMELYYQFLVGGGIPSSVKVTGYLNGNNDDLDVNGYDWVSSTWKQIGTLEGKAASTDEVNGFDMTLTMVGSGANEGIVRVQFKAASGLTTATLAIDQILLSFSRSSEGYANGAVWLDTNASNTNTVVGIDGTERNPVSTIAAANTLLAATNLARLEIAPGSTVTLAASQDNQIFFGHDWTLALGSQSISNSYFTGATVTGTATAASEPHFTECKVGEVVLPSCILRRCRLIGTTAGVTMSTSGGNYVFEQCFSGIAGATTPKLTFGAGAQTVNMRHYSGGIQLEGMINTQKMSLEGFGQLIEGTCTAGDVTIRGTFTISGITNVTLADDARIDTPQINTEADTAFSDYAPPTKAEMDTAHALLTTPAQVATALATYSGPTKAEMDTGHGLLATPAEMAAELATYGGPTKAEMDAAIAALNDLALSDITGYQLVDSIPADGTLPTLGQVLYMDHLFLFERSVSGTTVTVKKADGSTTLLTLTLDDATDPTSITRTT